VDPKSPDVAVENAALNGLYGDRIRFLAGDLLADASLRQHLGTGYDIVLANIVADVIIPLSPHVPAFLAPGGVYITSGIIEGRQDEVRHAIEDCGFRILAHTSEDDWHCFTATR
jgi:ribosomal protein L11 methyltransferase